MLDPSEVMPPSTASLFHLLNVESEISDFYLIGGTALALHIGHRISEDLDFITKAPMLLRDLKAIVCASRSSSRDWLDLYKLAQMNELDLFRWKLAFEKAGLTLQHFETALSRIRTGALPSTDPGFASLLPNPPNIQEITSFLMQVAEPG